MPKVSIVISAYNEEKHVQYCLNSVLSQTFTDYEILIVNNGSTDKTRDKIACFTDPRIKYIELKDNQGAAYAANIAMKQAKGEYIALLCADDMFHSSKLVKQVKFLDTHPWGGAVFSDIDFVDQDNNFLKETSELFSKLLPCARYREDFKVINMSRQEWLKFFMNSSHALFPSSAMIRKTCLAEVGYMNECIHQITDLDLWVKICLKYELHQLGEKLTSFRVHLKESKRVNVSNNSQASHHRSCWESLEMFNSYFNMDYSDVFKVFPELIKYECLYKESLREFFIILGFLMQDKVGFVDAVKVRACINKFYVLLKDKNVFEDIQSLGVTLNDFIGLTGSYAFNRPPSVVPLFNTLSNVLSPLKNSKERVVLYGAGAFAREFLSLVELSEINVVGLLDGDRKKRGSVVEGYSVKHLTDMKELNPSKVIVLLENPKNALADLQSYKSVNNLQFSVESIFADLVVNGPSEQSEIKNIFSKLDKCLGT